MESDQYNIVGNYSRTSSPRNWLKADHAHLKGVLVLNKK